MVTPRKDPKDYCKMGAPEFPYTQELANEICEAIAISPYGLRRICDENPHFPRMKTIYKWVLTIPDFAHKYKEARELQQETMVNDMVDMCHNRSRDFYTNKEGVEMPNSVAVARDKLIADNAKWSAARLSKRYKERKEEDGNSGAQEFFEQLNELVGQKSADKKKDY